MTGVSTLGQALRQIENLSMQQSRFSDLSSQMASGKKTQRYSGLNTDALTSLRSRASLASIQIYSNNILRSGTTIGFMLTTIEEFQEQSEQFSNTLISFIQEGANQLGDEVRYDDPGTVGIENTIVGYTSASPDIDFNAAINHAKNLFGFLGEMLNTKEGDKYLFAGADNVAPPYVDTGTLDAAVNTLLTEWKNGAITTEELIADITDRTAFSGNANALTDTVIGYSPGVSAGTTGDVFVRAGENSEFEYTTMANEESLRNIMVALAVLKNDNLPPIVDVYENGVYSGVPDVQGAPGATASEMQDNFYQLYNAVSQMVSRSIDGIDQTRFRMETVRAQMGETEKSYINQQTLLLSTISDVEDVDLNEVAVMITTLQTQLEASYSVTALSSQLSLVNYLL